MFSVAKKYVLAVAVCLLGIGQGFGAEFWADHVSQPTGDTTINGETFYFITTAEELAWFAKQTDHGTVTKDSAEVINAILKNDIDLGGNVWTPICPGGGGSFFNGVFDGNGHIISNLFMNGEDIYDRYKTRYSDKIAKDFVQNFGFIGTLGGGTVQNLILKDVDIRIINNITEDGKERNISAGPIVGWKSNKGKNSGKGVIDFCNASGKITTSGKGQAVGGLVGTAWTSTIQNSVTTVSIYASGDNAYVGGIVGATKSGEVAVKSCVFAGDTLVNSGEGGLTGIVGGKVYNGTGVKPSNVYSDYEGVDADGNPIAAVGNKTVTGATVQETLNTEDVVCYLNGGKWENNTCKNATSDKWSVGASGLSLNGSDGFKIVFNAKSGTFPENAKMSKIVAKDAPITVDEITSPLHNDSSFAGWSLSKIASEPSDEWGMATKTDTLYAVWYPFFTITFDASPAKFSDNTSVQTKSVAKNGTISVDGILLPDFYVTDDGKYYFTGWTDVVGGKFFDEKHIIDDNDTIKLASITVNENKTVYPVWSKVPTYRVTYHSNLHGMSEASFVRVVNEGDEAPVSLPENFKSDGYDLQGWCWDSDCNTPFVTGTKITGNTSLYANWLVHTFDIYYDLDGGVNDAENPVNYTIESADKALYPPSKEGSEFLGWFYDDAYANRATVIQHGSTGDLTLHAQWKPLTYTITYMSGKIVTKIIDPEVKQYGETINLKGKIDEFDVSCGEHDGWSLTDLGELKYPVGAEYSANENVILYPHWNCPSYDITYDMSGVDDAVNYFVPNTDPPKVHNPMQYTGPGVLTLKNAYDPQQKIEGMEERYFMDNWYKERTFKNTIREIKDLTAPITVYARWYNKIIYKPGSNVSGASDNVNKKYFDISHTLKSSIDGFTRENFTLDGWSTTDGGDKVYDLGRVLSKEFHSNLTLYPHWKANEFAITYNNVDGTINSNPLVCTVESEIILVDAVRSGYTFEGWFDAEDHEVTEISGCTGAIELTAKWVKNNNGAITFTKQSDGTFSAVINGNYGGGRTRNTEESDAVEITSDVTVSSVTLNRTFNANRISTLYVPFEIDAGKIGSPVYKFKTLVEEDGRWKFKITSASKVYANTPYVVIPEGTSISFDVDAQNPVIFNTTTTSNEKVSENGWMFRGVYAYENFYEDNDECENIYVFVNEPGNEFRAGQFAKIKNGAYINPFRAYLVHDESKYLAKSANGSLNHNIKLPDEIDVVIEDVNGIVVEQGTLNMVTGEVKMDRWYDLNGRKLNGKPTVKGNYFYNGKHVIVK